MVIAACFAVGFRQSGAMGDCYTLQTLDQVPLEGDRYGVIGYPVIHSLSPHFQLAGFKAANIPAVYVKIEVKPGELPAVVARLKELNFKGWNCTLPHKIELATLVDQLDDSARKLKAVNTVVNDGGRLVGFNTDGLGWVRAIRDEFHVDVRDLRVMVLGIGGAGQAVATQAALEKCERLVLVNRTVEKALALATELVPLMSTDKLMGSYSTRLEAIPWDEERIAQEINGIDLVVNCTSVGLKSYDPPVLPARVFQPHLMVYDTIYNPPRTKFLEAAQESGARCANGLGMLLHQGALSFEIWTSRKAPLAEMKQALVAAAAA